MRVLLVEDDAPFARALMRALAQSRIDVEWARDCAGALRLIARVAFEVAIVDWMLPDGEGPWLIERLRARGVTVPTLMLTARDALEDRVRGLDSGADDYLSKPFHLEELLARIHALGRRPHGYLPECPTLGDIELDPSQPVATVAGRRIELTPAEATILRVLITQAPAIASKRLLGEELELVDRAASSAGIETHMSRLRTKLRGSTTTIRAIRERGYLIEEGT